MKAIILAAGRGTRLLPFTLLKPKPLLEINGKSILETTIRALQQHNITQIVVITGHLHKKIESLKEKLDFETMFFKDFRDTNSAATLKYASSLLNGDCLLINGDSFILDSAFFSVLKSAKDSTLIAQHIAQTTALTWRFLIDENCNLLSIDKDAKSGLCECGISLIKAKNIESFKQNLLKCSKDDYYENAIYNTLKQCNYRVLEVKNSVYEIDSFKDALINNFLSPQSFAAQCSSNGEAIRLGGFTNYNFKINLNGSKVLRIPGVGTESFVDRELESKIIALVPPEVSTKTTFYHDYIKITDFLEGFSDQIKSDNLSTEFLLSLVKILKKLHSVKIPQGFAPMSLLGEIYKYESLSKKQIVTKEQREFILQTAKNLENDEQVLCHRDLLRGNVMYNGKEVRLVDFEYSGFCSKLWDIANFICEFDVPIQKTKEFINLYGTIAEEEVLGARVLVHYIWGLWYIVNNAKQEEERHLKGLYECLNLLNIS